MGSLSMTHWLIVLAIVSLVFGTKKLRSLGADLGGAIKGFKEGVADHDAAPAQAIAQTTAGADRTDPVDQAGVAPKQAASPH